MNAAGQVWAWGFNDTGQLGDGTVTTREITGADRRPVGRRRRAGRARHDDLPEGLIAARASAVDGVGAQVGQRAVLQRRQVRRRQAHLRVRCRPRTPPATGRRTGTTGRRRFRPAKPYCGIGVLRSLPACLLNARNSSVITAHTTCMPGIVAVVLAAARAVVAGQRVERAGLQVVAEHVALTHASHLITIEATVHLSRSRHVDVEQLADAVGDDARGQHDQHLAHRRLRPGCVRRSARSSSPARSLRPRR